jgi:hypothetical protein
MTKKTLEDIVGCKLQMNIGSIGYAQLGEERYFLIVHSSVRFNERPLSERLRDIHDILTSSFVGVVSYDLERHSQEINEVKEGPIVEIPEEYLDGRRLWNEEYRLTLFKKEPYEEGSIVFEANRREDGELEIVSSDDIFIQLTPDRKGIIRSVSASKIYTISPRERKVAENARRMKKVGLNILDGELQTPRTLLRRPRNKRPPKKFTVVK